MEMIWSPAFNKFVITIVAASPLENKSAVYMQQTVTVLPLRNQPHQSLLTVTSSAVQILKISDQIKQSVTIRFDPKQIQPFEIFEYLF